MSLTNKATRDRLVTEKSHGLSLAVRVEDRLHRDIIDPADECWLTIRSANYVVGTDDSDAEYSADASQISTLRGTVFQFDVQAADLNLDPEQEWWYTISLVRSGYPFVILSGVLEVAPNVTNRGAGETFTSDAGVYELIATIDGRQLLNVTSTLPMPEKGDSGLGSYITSDPLSEVVGDVVVVDAATIQTYGRALQDGDVIFSSSSKGVLGVVSARTFDGGGLISANVTIKQVYGLETLKALLDVVLRGTEISTVDTTWSVPKADCPLPESYQYHEGDFVFSSSAESEISLNKNLVISHVDSVEADTLTVTSKIVFPMFADAGAMDALFAAKVDKTTTVNAKPLSADISLTTADIGDSGTKVMMLVTERTKLASLPDAATLTALLSAKAAVAHTHAQADVTGLVDALAAKVAGSGVSTIWKGTQAAYDAIVTKDSNTLYFITV